MTTQTQTATAIIYPETDGQPMPDGEYQAPIYVDALATLRTHYENSPGVRVNGNTFLYYVQGNPNMSVSPDCYVATGLSPEQQENIDRNNTYRLWEVGKPPEFVMEIASENTKSNDLIGKRALYADLGISEYWRYDQTGGDFYGEPLVGERLVDGEYERIQMREDDDGRAWAHSDALNLDLYWDDGDLRFWDPVAQEWLLKPSEEHAARLAAESRAEREQAGRLSAESRADQEQAGRLAAEDRADQEQAGRLTEQAAREAAESRAQAAESRIAQEQAARLEEQAARQALEARLAELQAQLRQPPRE